MSEYLKQIANKNGKTNIYELLGVPPQINANRLSTIYNSLPVFQNTVTNEDDKKKIYDLLFNYNVRNEYDRENRLNLTAEEIKKQDDFSESDGGLVADGMSNGLVSSANFVRKNGASIALLGLLTILDGTKQLSSFLASALRHGSGTPGSTTTAAADGTTSSVTNFSNVITNILNNAKRFEELVTTDDPTQNVTIKMAKFAASLGYTFDTVLFASKDYIMDAIDQILAIFQHTMNKLLNTGSQLANTAIAGIPLVGSVFALVSSVLRITELAGTTVSGFMGIKDKVLGVFQTIASAGNKPESLMNKAFSSSAALPKKPTDSKYSSFVESLAKAESHQRNMLRETLSQFQDGQQVAAATSSVAESVPTTTATATANQQLSPEALKNKDALLTQISSFIDQYMAAQATTAAPTSNEEKASSTTAVLKGGGMMRSTKRKMMMVVKKKNNKKYLDQLIHQQKKFTRRIGETLKRLIN